MTKSVWVEVMSEPWVLSASQLSTFRECQRKWGWEKIDGIEQPEKVSTAFGSEVHRILEDYLRDGTKPDRHRKWHFTETETHPSGDEHTPKVLKKRWTLYPGATALTMIGPHLVKPGVGTVEGEFKWHDKENDIHWRGFIDHTADMDGVPGSMVSREALAVISEHHDPECHSYSLVRITDHKTSIDPVKYGKTEATLLEDTQRVLYGHVWWETHVHDYGGVRVGEYVWNYGARDSKPSKARVVQAYESPYGTYQRYKLLVPDAKALLEAKATAKTAMELPPNPGACENYGGCPHKSRCNLSSKQKLGALIMGNSLIDDLLGEGDAAVETTAEVVEDPEPAKKTRAKKQPKAPAKDMLNPPETPREASEPEAPKGGALDKYDDAMAQAIAELVVEKLAAKLGAK